MALTQIKSSNIEDGTVAAADVATDAITNVKVASAAAIATSKLSGAATGIANHGLGSAALLTAGTAAGNVLVLDGSGNLPAVSGAALTGIETDLTSIRQDIVTLALHSAITDNKIAYNLPFAFIDQFQDDSGILTETTVDRDSSDEYVGTTLTAGALENFTSDANTLVLLHFDGTQNQQTFPDSSSHNRTITRTQGGAPLPQLYTNQKKLGTASIYFGIHNGSVGHHGNSISIPDHNDWNFEANAFTVECWVYIESAPSGSNGSMHIGGQAGSNTSDATGAYHISLTPAMKVQTNVYRRNGSNTSNDISVQSAGTISLNTWTHVAVARDGHTLRMYFDGVQTATLAVPSDNSYKLTANNMGGDWWISRRAYSTSYGYISGRVDEYRISNICRYPNGTTFSPNVTAGSLAAAGTLISNAQTAPAATTLLSGVFLYTDTSGTATLGTDLKIYMSADNGSNFTEASSYGTAQTFSGPSPAVKMVRLGETTVTSGTQVKLKAVWANQVSGTKETRLNGWAINY